MDKFRVKGTSTIIRTLAAISTSVIIILTFLITHHFTNNAPIFNSCLLLQIGICVTMILWAIRFFLYRKGRERYIHVSVCITISIISLFFVMNSVK